MSEVNTIDVLNRLLAIHQCSFIKYLTYARPFARSADEPITTALERIVADQQAISEQISAVVVEAGAQIRSGEFPMDFTGQHDLAMVFLLRRAAEYHRQDIAAIEACVADLALAPAAKSLAEEALGMARGHLESIEELVIPITSS